MALAFAATYYKFMRHVDPDTPFPWLDMAGTLLLVFGGVVSAVIPVCCPLLWNSSSSSSSW